MDRITLNQWMVMVDGQEMGMFTPLNCTAETAMAIAVETFGSGVTDLVDEGAVKRELTNAQFAIADPAYCAECGGYKDHEDTCSRAEVR